MLIFIKLLSLYLFGFSVVNLLNHKSDFLEKLGLSFLLGTGFSSLIYFLYIWRTDRIVSGEFWLMILFLFLIFLAINLIRKNYIAIKLPNNIPKFKWLPILCWFVILFLFVCSIIITSYTPVHNPDSLYLFDFRAKVMHISHTLSEIRFIENWDVYPMFTSMIGLIWRFTGIENPSSYYPIMYLSFSFIFYSILKKFTNINIASIGTLLMYTTPVTFWQSQLDGMTNIPYTVFLCLSSLYILKMVRSGNLNFSDVFLSAIFLGLSAWTRGIEPLWIVPLFFVTLILVLKRKTLWLLIYYIFFSLIRELWQFFVNQRYTSIQSGVSALVEGATAGAATSANFLNSVSYTAKSMFKLLPASIGLVWYLFFAVLFLTIIVRKISTSQLYVFLTIIGILTVIYFGSLFMVVSFGLVIDVYNDSLSRLLGTLPPLLWIYIILSPTWMSVENMIKSVWRHR